MKIKKLREMSKKEQEEKIKELKFELVKSKINASKTGSMRAREIRRNIARLLTISNNSNNKQ
ncbi:MAG: 50S ribosomal protein L29 [Nanoarchaeota archaeon]|nr:50S ribosomal protein L29 [Nanoarchaeota archaeon]